MSERYGFGQNWAKFINTSFTPERRDIAKQNLLSFLQRKDLEGIRFLDIGSGSGLHSMAAYDAGASRVHSFDYDSDSVATTNYLRQMAGGAKATNWTIEQGDVLDKNYMDALGQWDIVYSWGVLHHTGALWKAIDNAMSAVASRGLFFIALYSSNVASPSTEFWLATKQRYNKTGRIGKRWMEIWYLWRFGIDRRPWRLPMLLQQMTKKREGRGMSYMTDVRDWLGGWPMEYSDDNDVIQFVTSKLGFKLLKCTTGQACTEFLFERH